MDIGFLLAERLPGLIFSIFRGQRRILKAGNEDKGRIYHNCKNRIYPSIGRNVRFVRKSWNVVIETIERNAKNFLLDYFHVYRGRL